MSPPEGADRPERPGRAGAAALAVTALELRRMPGFEERPGFALGDLAPGVNLVHGPNGVGKSTTAAALARAVWPQSGGPGEALTATLDVAGESWRVDLEHGRVRRRREGAETGEEPPVPPAETAERYRLALHDLLRAEVTGERFAAQVARELAGGFDLAAAAEAAGGSARPKRPAALLRDLETARRDARLRESHQQKIAADEADLARRRAELDEARAAGEAAAALDRVLTVVEQRRRCREAEAELAAFPEVLERSTGREPEELDEIDRELERATAERLDLDRRRRRAEADRTATGLPPAGVADERLRTLEARVEELAAAERAVAEAERRRAEAAERAAVAARRLPPSGEPPEARMERLAALGVDEWRPVVDLARRAERLAAEAEGHAVVGDWLRPRAEEAADADREAVARAGELLRRWLRTAGPEAAAADRRARWTAGVAALVLAGTGAAGMLIADPIVAPFFWGLELAASGFALWAILGGRGGGRERRELAAALDRPDLAMLVPEGKPPAWRPADVERALAALEERTAAARFEAFRAERRADLEGARRRTDERRAELAAESRALAAAVGVAPEAADGAGAAPLAALVQDLCAWREAEREERAARAARAVAEADRRRHLEAIAADLGAVVGGAADPPADLAAARGAIKALAERARAHREATRQLEHLTGEAGLLPQAEERLAALAERRRALFARLGLADGDRAGLERLLGRSEEYRACRERLDRARGALEVATAAADEAAAHLDRPAEGIAAERDRLAARAAEAPALEKAITEIEVDVRKAKERHDLEEALAAVDAARAALADQRAADAEAIAVDLLAGWLRGEVRGRHRPPVLERAAELVVRITHGRYELLDPEGEPPEILVRETETGVVRPVEELSSGVRVQLLVAVRMASIERGERGVRVPLVLDETLANSDERSAAALVDAVVEVARGGRQVFYFTAQLDEVARWQAALERAGDVPAATIDLAAVRRLAAPRRQRRPEPPARPPVPPPEGASRETYLERLGVPGIDPRRGTVDAVHLGHLVADPELLHHLLAAGLERWGELRATLEGGGDALLEVGGNGSADGVRGRLFARARCLEVLVDGWRIGRGSPVDRGVLAASGAVSDAFLDDVAALAAEVGGDARRLLTGLEERRVKGFRRDKIDQLRSFLAEHGHLDPRDPLDAAALRRRALERLGDLIGGRRLAVAELDELLAQLPGV